MKRGSKGVEWQFNSADVIEWRISRAVEAATDGLLDQDGRTSKDEADRRRAVANAIVAEVEADEKLGSVIARYDAETVISDFCQSLRSALDNAGAKIAGRATTMTNASEIRDLATDVINKAYQEAETDLRERWSYGGEIGGGDLGPD